MIRRLSAVPLLLVLGACSGAASWTHDQDAEIGPETTAFPAWVTETGCAGGQPSTDRVEGPDIQVSQESILVTFRVRKLSAFGASTCPSNPATLVSVGLPEPLGDRMLLDGGRQPPLEPPVCSSRELDGRRYCY